MLSLSLSVSAEAEQFEHIGWDTSAANLRPETFLLLATSAVVAMHEDGTWRRFFCAVWLTRGMFCFVLQMVHFNQCLHPRTIGDNMFSVQQDCPDVALACFAPFVPSSHDSSSERGPFVVAFASPSDATRSR